MLNAPFFEAESPDPSLKPYLKKFLSDRMAQLDILEKSLENQDFKLIQKLAHQWRGFCAPFGFGFLTPLCESLEGAAHDGAWQDCQDLILQIRPYLEKKAKELGHLNPDLS